MTTAATAPTKDVTPALRKLYLFRFAFAIVWAILIFATGSDIGPLSGTLLVLYPAFDVAAVVVDLRSSRGSRPALGLYLNVALSAISALTLAVALSSGIPDVLRAWGAWAVAAGLVQLVVALGRRQLGGQLPMILSGAISVLAGGGFITMASGDDPALSALGGYAALGGIFFLASALRLGRTESAADHV